MAESEPGKDQGISRANSRPRRRTRKRRKAGRAAGILWAGRAPAITLRQYEQILAVAAHDIHARRRYGETFASLAREWKVTYEVVRSAARQGIKRYDHALRRQSEPTLKLRPRRYILDYWCYHLGRAVDEARR